MQRIWVDDVNVMRAAIWQHVVILEDISIPDDLRTVARGYNQYVCAIREAERLYQKHRDDVMESHQQAVKQLQREWARQKAELGF